jgi:IrrE N-terminal-like domain
VSERPGRFDVWRERLAATDDDHQTVLEVLSGVAQEISDARNPEGSPAARWASAGIEVRVVRLHTRGYCEIDGRAVPLVHVSSRDNSAAQHFTIAHEVGHLLLASLPDSRRAGISRREEERICNDFAQRLIVPPARLARELDGEHAPSPEKVLALCGTFQANPSTMLRALDAQRCLKETAYLLARLRAHYRRPAALGFRIDASAGPETLFWPLDTRIEKLGLTNLALNAASASHGELFDGTDDAIEVRLAKVDRQTGQNGATGPADWRAVRQGRDSPYLLARVDCSSLQATRMAKPTQQEPSDDFSASVPRVQA